MKNYSILITAALPIEMQALKKRFKQEKIIWAKFHFLSTGVGNYNAIYSLQEYLSRWKQVDFILNIGVCGKRDESISHMPFQVYRIKNFANQKESVVPIYINIWNLQSIWSSEKVIVSSESMQEEEYVDMESYGIDFISKKYKIPYSIIKFPFDIVSSESLQVNKSDISELLGDFDYAQLGDKIVTWCNRNIWENAQWEKYNKHFWFTVAESEIFKKQYHKLWAFWIDFEVFFAENKDLHKKAFLEKITQT